MKISVIGPTYPYKGGISHYCTKLVENLRQNNEVDFISWKRQYPSFLYPVEQKDLSSKERIATDADYLLDFYNPLSWLKAADKVKRQNADMLLINWVTPVQSPIYSVITNRLKSIADTRIVYACHNVMPHEESFYNKPLAKMAFNKVDTFIVHSSEDKQILEDLVKDKHIVQGYLPLFDMFKNEGSYNVAQIKKELGLGEKVLLFFGYIRPYKGLRFLLQAMPKIVQQFPDLKLLIVGEFWEKDKQSYFDLINELQIKDRIVLVNEYVPNEEVGKYFAVSDVVVLPYVTATQSAAVQTAYGFDKPVISTSVGGLKDSVIEGQTGYFVKGEDAADIADKVRMFYEKPINSQTVRDHKHLFSWEKYLEYLK